MKKILLVAFLIMAIFQIVVSAALIDVGNVAINRLDSSETRTLVDRANPANASGIITSVEIWANVNLTSCKVATFFNVDATHITTRDYELIGSVTSGSKQTFTVDLNINASDIIGMYFASGGMELNIPSGSCYYLSGDYIPCTNEYFSGSTWKVSLYGTGLTVPAQVTGVAATDGDHTDKVRVTWNAASGATKYYVWNGSSWVDVGNVTTWDHTGAPAPTITPGTASASDGTSSEHVALSITGESANNGSSISYKVKAWNAAGYGAESASNSGYRGVGSLTYQWQRSAADSDADYSNIDGATTDPYNDTGAPADGSGRYYKCIENATGATQQTTNSDRGYRAAEEEGEDNTIFFGTNF
jgi:hypothetical protein